MTPLLCDEKILNLVSVERFSWSSALFVGDKRGQEHSGEEVYSNKVSVFDTGRFKITICGLMEFLKGHCHSSCLRGKNWITVGKTHISIMALSLESNLGHPDRSWMLSLLRLPLHFRLTMLSKKVRGCTMSAAA